MRRRVNVKPGKGQSFFGFLGGIVFCIIGLTVAVPIFGMFGLLWTGIAVVITIANAVNAFSDKGIISHSIEIEDDRDLYDTNNYSNQNFDVEERLKKLNDLYDQRLITEEEFKKKKEDILSRL